MIEAFNLFPESRYLRIRRNSELDHKCGGIASLGIIIVLLIVLSIKLMQVFKKATVFANFKEEIDFEPAMTPISTYQNDYYQSPYMMAIAFQNRGCSNASRTLNLWYITYNLNGSYLHQYETKEKINMETCTAEHFSNIPQIKNNVDALGISNWMCLPLNNKINLGGRLDISDITTSLQVEITCDVTCPVDFCGSTMVYQLNSLINPNNEEPFQYFLTRNDMDISANTFNYYKIFIDKNVLETDHSIWPTSNVTRKQSYSSQPMEHRASIEYNSKKQTYLYIERSSTTKTVTRKYLKMIDVLSYVGGIFPALFGIFFFMKFFGMYFYQMTFAYQHFKCRETRYNTFGHFLKNTIYQTLSKLGCKPQNWRIAKRQCQINTLINKMLDINYLYKRIQFLETGLSALLDDHQLKGVYLSQVTLKNADQLFQKHRLRDRVIKYLQQKVNWEKKQDAYQSQEKMMTQIKKPGKKKSKKKSSVTQQDERQKGNSAASLKKGQEDFEPQKLKKKGNLAKSCSIDKASAGGQLPQRQRNRILLNIESQMIEIIDADAQKVDEDLYVQLEYDLRKLFKEARAKKGDPVSKRIVENIDDWLRSQLEIAIDEYEMQNPRFEFKLTEEDEKIE